MSVITSVELRGEFNNINNVITLLMSLDLKKKLLFDGKLIIGEYNSSRDFVDSIYLPVNFNNEQEVFDFLKGYKNLASLYIGVKIKSSYHYFTFYFSDDKSINFTIDGNRRKIDNRYTDFSWYFTNFIYLLINDKFNLDSIIYSDE